MASAVHATQAARLCASRASDAVHAVRRRCRARTRPWSATWPRAPPPRTSWRAGAARAWGAACAAACTPSSPRPPSWCACCAVLCPGDRQGQGLVRSRSLHCLRHAALTLLCAQEDRLMADRDECGRNRLAHVADSVMVGLLHTCEHCTKTPPASGSSAPAAAAELVAAVQRTCASRCVPGRANRGAWLWYSSGARY